MEQKINWFMLVTFQNHAVMWWNLFDVKKGHKKSEFLVCYLFIFFIIHDGAITNRFYASNVLQIHLPSCNRPPKWPTKSCWIPLNYFELEQATNHTRKRGKQMFMVDWWEVTKQNMEFVVPSFDSLSNIFQELQDSFKFSFS